jgi:hypothetical protein
MKILFIATLIGLVLSWITYEPAPPCWTDACITYVTGDVDPADPMED